MAKMNTSSSMEFSHIDGKLTPVRISMSRTPTYQVANPDGGDQLDQKPDDNGMLEEVVGHLLSEHGNDDLQNKDMQDDQALGKGVEGQHSDGDKVGEIDPDEDEDEDDDQEGNEEDMKKAVAAFEAGEDVEAICKKHVGFAKLKGKLASKGAKNPGALAAYIGKAKYGAKKMAAAAGKGKALTQSQAK